MTVRDCPLCRVPYGRGPCRACETAREFQSAPLVRDAGPFPRQLVREIQDTAASPRQEREMFDRLEQRLEAIADWPGPYRPARPAAPGDADGDEEC